MSGIEVLKADMRRAAYVRRKDAFAAGQGQAAELLADVLNTDAGKVLSGYLAMRSEIDPRAAMAAHPGPVAVPVIIGKGLPLRFREWSPGCAVVPGSFGTQVPAEGVWLEPEVLIVPLLAFDARGFRLGYGGGYYDRTLAGLRAKAGVLAVGFAFAAQEVAQVPVDGFDQRLDMIVTEAGVIRFSGP